MAIDKGNHMEVNSMTAQLSTVAKTRASSKTSSIIRNEMSELSREVRLLETYIFIYSQTPI